MRKKTLIIINIAGLLVSLVWLMKDQTLEPLITSLGLIGSLIALLYSGGSGNKTIMNQKGGKGSTNYQSKGNININK